MTAFSEFETMARSLPEVTTAPHFEKISFRVRKKIFATYDPDRHIATVKLSAAVQEKYKQENESIYPVNNKWGQQGWTIVELDTVSEKLLEKLLIAAYCEVAPKTLAKQIKNDQ